MFNNPCIAVIARILASNEPPGALATILFDHYSALSYEKERNAFAIALIGELLVRRACHLAPSEVSEGSGMPEIEITPKMIEAGVNVAWQSDLLHPDENELAAMVEKIFRKMLLVSHSQRFSRP